MLGEVLPPVLVCLAVVAVVAALFKKFWVPAVVRDWAALGAERHGDGARFVHDGEGITVGLAGAKSVHRWAWSITTDPLPGLPDVGSRGVLGGVRTGDEYFDKAFLVSTDDEAVSLAVASAENRRLMTDLVNAEGWVKDGRVTLIVQRHEDQREQVELLTRFARAFQPPPDIPAALRERARDDPEPGVRLHALELLASRYGTDQSTVQVIRAAMADPDPTLSEGARALAERIPGLESGRLSMTDAGHGRLSEAAGGELSLPDPEPS